MNKLNNESFICDQQCFETIAYFKTKYINHLNFNVNDADLEIIQDDIRKLINIHVFPNLKGINNKKVKPSKPNYYAVFILILLNQDNTIETILKTFTDKPPIPACQ